MAATTREVRFAANAAAGAQEAPEEDLQAQLKEALGFRV